MIFAMEIMTLASQCVCKVWSLIGYLLQDINKIVDDY